MSIVAVVEIGDASKRHLVWIDPNSPTNHLVALDFLPEKIVDASTPLYVGLSTRSGALEWEEDGKVIRGLPDGVGGYFDITDSNIPVLMFHRYRPTRAWLPTLTRPECVTPEAALAQQVYGATWEAYLEDEDRVLGIDIAGEARAYPVKIMKYHEIVNDEIGPEAVAIVYSPLSGSAMAYEAVVGDGTTTFGNSGFLLNSTTLTYDEKTLSLWGHFDGTAVAGPMQGKQLKILPLVQTTWKTWKGLHPNSLVLSASTGYQRMFPYGLDPYRPNFQNDYFADERLAAPVEVPGGTYELLLARLDDRLSNKEWVIGIREATSERAYPIADLAESGENPFPIEFEGRQVRIQYDPEAETGFVVDEKGNVIPEATLTLWFAWKVCFPATEVYLPGEPGSL